MPTEIGQCATVFNQKKSTETGPFVTQNRPKAVVFYCSWGMQRSPEMAYRYLEWLEQKNFVQTEVAYISKGVFGYSTFAKMKLEKLLKEIETIEKAKYSKLTSLLFNEFS